MVAELTRQVWCDVCADQDTKSLAVCEQVVRLDDAPSLQIDLCQEHRSEFVDALEAILTKIGRTPDAMLATRPPRKLGRPPKSDENGESCPICGLVYSRKNLSRHLRDVHQAELDGDFKCPECGRAFERPQSVGVHRRFTHGVIGTSQSAQSKRGQAG